ncbi:MAG: hypothetical protein WC816_12635 [Sphingomonas sp.]|jgi:hypothetical protein
MITDLKPLRFGHHAFAVLGAAMLGSTVFSIILTTALAITANHRLPGAAGLATLAALFWLGVFIVALPGAGIVLTLLFPITRRRTSTANSICLIAGATTGVILAPVASLKFHGASALQIGVFALAGIAIAGFYLIIGGRLSRDGRVPVKPPMPIV